MSEESFHSFTTPAIAADATREHVPLHLRPSTGSCHDLCKYGKHAVAEKKKKATLTRVSDPTTLSANGLQVSRKQDVPSSNKVGISVKIATSKAQDSNMCAKRATSMKPVHAPGRGLSRGIKMGPKPFLGTVAGSNKITRSEVSGEVELETNGGSEKKGVLLNSIIEEAASKLSQLHKSKVKALVGAFETVISLQDPKISAFDYA